jgi:hypothetical protein
VAGAPPFALVWTAEAAVSTWCLVTFEQMATALLAVAENPARGSNLWTYRSPALR